MQANKTSFLDHLRWIRDAVLGRGGDFLVVGVTLQLALRRSSQHWLLEPRFLDEHGRPTSALPPLDGYLTGFAGWLPYEPSAWDVAGDRIRFRTFLREHSLPVPELHADDDSPGAVLVRRAGMGNETAHGPYRDRAEHPLSADEFFDPFLAGTRVRLWYWNGAALCGEFQQMPTIAGNGGATVRELILERASSSRPLTDEQQGALLARLSPLLNLQGHALAATLPAGAKAVVDHLMDSPLLHPADRQTFLVEGGDELPWLSTARRAGDVIMSAAPEDLRSQLLFTLDGVIDAAQQLCIVEMNANPVVHPILYPAIVATILEGGAASADGQVGDPEVSHDE